MGKQRQYEAIGYVLVAFMMDCDAYHWKAIYIKADQFMDVVQKGLLDKLAKT